MPLKSAEARSIIGKVDKFKAPAIAGAFFAGNFNIWKKHHIFLQLAIDNSPKKEYSVLKQEQFEKMLQQRAKLVPSKLQEVLNEGL